MISGFQTKQSRSTDSIKLISWGLRNTNTYEISEKNLTTFTFKTWLGKKEFIEGVTKEDVYITIQKKEVKNLKTQIKYNGPIVAPIAKGDEIGTLIVSKDDQEIRSVKIYANEDIKKVNFLRSLFMSFNYLIWGDV